VICDKFLPRAVKKSTRYLYLEMVSAACQFMLDSDFSNKTQTPDSFNYTPLILPEISPSDYHPTRKSSFDNQNSPKFTIIARRPLSPTIKPNGFDNDFFLFEQNKLVEEDTALIE
jgi:hypothetical protein